MSNPKSKYPMYYNASIGIREKAIALRENETTIKQGVTFANASAESSFQTKPGGYSDHKTSVSYANYKRETNQSTGKTTNTVSQAWGLDAALIIGFKLEINITTELP